MPAARDEQDQKFLDIIELHGWHVTLVHADEENPRFAYSSGIHALTGKPELIVFGLPNEVAHAVINGYGKRLRAGEIFAPGDFVRGFLEGHPITFISVEDEDLIKEHATWTDWFYEGLPFPLLQLVYPDSKSGAFPWQPDYREEWHWHQPLLGAPPVRS